ncbi:putative sugar transporter, high affinity [Myxozyma melibiosi]|uniref:Sugar transporter, high affinity n=1 Tax=Myxozyma melibiosi TaxID=54550 RepID=A0ABR1F2A7_9ASCO
MAPTAGGDAIPNQISSRRLRLAGPRGIRGIVANSQIFAIAVFASLGGLVYGYNQGMFGQILNMSSFAKTVHPESISNPTARGLLTAILELGAWVGAMANGYIADKLGRKLCVDVAVFVFVIGVIVQACAKAPSYILGGRFITGLGVGSLSMIVPLYNAELAPAEIRGALVALQQLSITAGIMIAYWIGYGTNFIGGTGDGQSNAAWLVPICIQIAPALILGVGMNFMPQSPRWLMSVGREEECLQTVAHIRRADAETELVVLEFLEIKAQRVFDTETSQRLFPQYQDHSFKSDFMLGFHAYARLLTSPTLLKRTLVAVLIMLFQQWTGINAVLYYAPFIFQDLGLTGNSVSLLASGVVGVVMFLATIPAVIYIDNLGRKPVLVCGAIGMAICHFVIAGISASFDGVWDQHKAAGWVAVVFVWLFVVHFGYSWGPAAWIVVAEVFPLGVRAKGISIGASSNWLNNFAVAMATSDMLATMKYGTYIFFGLFCVSGATYVYFIVPETKGRTLEEMDEVFHDDSGEGRKDLERMDKIWHDLGMFNEVLPSARDVIGSNYEKGSIAHTEV